MASITSPGIGSGLDVNGIITKLMALEQQPLTKLDTKEVSYQSKLSAFGTLKGAFSSLQTSAKALTSTTLFAGKSATSSDTAVLSSSANTAAAAGKYSIKVTDLAAADSLASAAFTSLTDDLIPLAGADGKIKIELGTLTTGVFTADTNKTAVTIDITQAASSLSDIRDKINEANAGVRANLVFVGKNATTGDDEYKITISSNDSGAKNSIRLSVLDSAGAPATLDNTGLAKLSYDPAAAAGSGKEFTVSTAAQDAELEIDGLVIKRSSNTIADAITGVTLTALKAGTSTLTVAQDTSSISTAVTTFVKAYNDANTQLRDLTAFNNDTKTGALLFGDNAARGLQSAMLKMISYAFPGGGTNLKRLADVGVSMNRDGSLTFTSSTLTKALSTSSSEVSALFTTTTSGSLGLASYMNGQLTSILAKTDGLFSSKTDGINRSIKELGTQRDRLSTRLAQIEKRYRAQYSSLDTIVASMQQTSQYLTQQLANLPSSK